MLAGNLKFCQEGHVHRLLFSPLLLFWEVVGVIPGEIAGAKGITADAHVLADTKTNGHRDGDRYWTVRGVAGRISALSNHSQLPSFKDRSNSIGRHNQMAQESSDPIATAAAEFQEEYGEEGPRIQAALDRIVTAFGIDLSNPGIAVLDLQVMRLFLDGVEATSADFALSLIEQVEPRTIAQRSAALAFLLRSATPVYTIPQLASRITGFIGFLKKNQDFMVNHGLPPRVFRRSRWLYVQLARLYDTRRTCSPWPADEYWPRRRAIERVRPYTWLRLVPSTDEIGLECSKRVDCDYAEASLLPGMGEEQAARLEFLRPKFFDLKVKVLEMVASALRERKPDQLWDRATELITESLLAPDADFLLEMDRFYLGVDAREDGAQNAPEKMVPGGLTNLYEIVGHCEKELRVGSFSTTAAKLAALAAPDDIAHLRRACLTAQQSAYFTIKQDFPSLPIDYLIDYFLELSELDNEFWASFRHRLNESLTKNFRTKHIFSVEIEAKFSKDFQAYMKPLIPALAAAFKAGVPMTIGLSQAAQGEHIQAKEAPEKALSTLNRFCKSRRGWRISYAGGESLHYPDYIGFFYIAVLLAKQGMPMTAGDLLAARVSFEQPATPSNDSTCGESPEIGEYRPRDGGSVTTYTQREKWKERVEELDEEFEEATSRNDEAEMEKIQRERDSIARAIKSATGLGGKLARVSDKDRVDRDKVKKAIKRARQIISEEDSMLGEHFHESLKLEDFLRYEPADEVQWDARLA